MNETLQRLSDALAPTVSKDDLIAALHLIRAPRHLHGIIPAARQFRDWRNKYPELRSFPDRTDYDAALSVLDRIADLVIADKKLDGQIIVEKKYSPWTSLYPLTGDSVICELLLIQARAGVNTAHFAQLCVWVFWQALRFHNKFVPIETYKKKYLSSTSMRLNVGYGSRLYAAFQDVRAFATENKAHDLQVFLAGLQPLTPEHSRFLGAVAQQLLGKRSLDVGRLNALAKLHNEPMDASFRQCWTDWAAILPKNFSLLLRSIWNTVDSHQVGTQIRQFATNIRNLQTPQIRHSDHLLEVLQRVNDDDRLHAGVSATFFDKPKSPRKNSSDDPPEASIDFWFGVFLGWQPDQVKNYFAAKGLEAAYELANALLYFNRRTLSETAIAAIVDWVSDPRKSNSLDQAARLAVGLSLISGRSLDNAAATVVTDEAPSAWEPKWQMVIYRPEQCLYVRAGAPQLHSKSKVYTDADTVDLLRPHGTWLRLPLPPSWEKLWADVQKPLPKGGVLDEAKRLLKQFPEEYAITQEGIRTALHRLLSGHTRGDLGALAVLTDEANANARNIVHYASFETTQLEDWWRKSAQKLVGQLPKLAPHADQHKTVGTPSSFDDAALKAHFQAIKERLQKAIRFQHWVPAYNLLTLYISQWLGLGLAQRQTLDPVPTVILQGDWALVADKSRRDGSTDRLVPITKALQQQLEAYVTLASNLAITWPELDPLVETENGTEIRLQYLLPRRKGQYVVTPYVTDVKEVRDYFNALPANWGRKVLRSKLLHLPGRWMDAELGHWARGRHAWDATSTLDAGAFHRVWRKRQQELERLYGFTPIAISGLRTHQRPIRLALPQHKNARYLTPPAIAKIEEVNFPVAETLQPLEATPKDIRGAMALKLVRDFIDNHEDKGLKALRPIVEGLCLHARERYKVPLFVVQPRRLFANPAILDGPALQALSVLQERVLPAFEADLARLPPRPAIPMGTRPWHALKDTDRAELGRLLMLGIWRLGLQRWSAVSSWLTALLGKKGEPEVILAQGNNRYMVLSVACDGSRPSMRRTVFLDDFTAAYLALELPTLRPLLQSLLTPDSGETAKDLPAQEEALGAEEDLDSLDEDRQSEGDPETEVAAETKDDSSIKEQGALPADTTDQQRKKKASANRYSRAQTCLNAYLQQIDGDLKNLSLSTLFAAAGQHLMMTTAPIISAYAMGKIETEDLGDRDIRRLGGLTPSRGNGREDENRRPNTSVWNVQTPPIPKDVLAHEKIWSVIGPHQGLRKQKWLRQIKSYAPKTPIEALLQQFAIWQIEQLDNKLRKDQTPFSPSQSMSRHEVRVILRNSRIIASLFLGFSSTQGTTTRLDRDALQRLHVFGSEHFTEREMQQVWRRFYAFLGQNKHQLKGFEISEIGNASDDNISAHLLSAEELETIRDLLLSPKSGIGNVDYRQIAQRHFDLMRNFGLRRAESAYLRGIDIQGNLGRVQPYGRHTLKTTNATRTLPLAFADQTTQSWMQKASEAKHQQLINIDAEGFVEPDNFYSALNTLIKKVSQEDNMGSHHIRHTLASRALLTLLWEAAGLQRLTNDFPWLTGLKLPDGQIKPLFGPEGDAGQGMRAISALVGHSHPTTTLRHYIHILCIALRGALDKTDTLNMRHSFIQRLGPRSTAFRTLANAGLLPPEGKGSPSRRELNRKIRLWIEQRTKNASLIVNETPLIRPRYSAQLPRKQADKQVKILFDDLERLDRVLRGEAPQAQTQFDLQRIRERMVVISKIPSGKRGTAGVARHDMQEVAEGLVLPQRVPAKTATEAAEALCNWLEALRCQKEDVFHWLLEKWLYDSERERGRMRLKTPQDEALFEALPQTQHVRMVKEAKVLSQRDKSGKTKPAAYMRLRYVSSEGKLSNRDLITVRWVMTFVGAVWGDKALQLAKSE